ncbi:probable E3 ubiquitin-protein ligase RHY1A [Lotus japonicus]|uniref:probable E3 ubiquitin-protein ligase RHY1A n=1 Tax=Lotus japonicus TaxID=34305 RepID=UPI00258AAFAF|nr:probable E3 ubiquitin-protein ligase RHY1A [Lotus japonicus]
MTSASELFHIRRNRFGARTTALDLAFDSSPSAPHHRFHDPDAAAAAASLRLRRRRHHPERYATDRIHGVGRHRRSASAIHDRTVDSAENVMRGTDRLPDGVLLARARLLQRLRGEPLSRTRQYGSDSMDEDQESELSSDVPTGASLVTDLTSQMERSQLLLDLNNKPPGLTQEDVNCLHLEVFRISETGLESRVQDCSICLESFTDGDELIRLPCGHKFHSACLDPWIRCCGDCPYCRRCIVVNSHLEENEAE